MDQHDATADAVLSHIAPAKARRRNFLKALGLGAGAGALGLAGSKAALAAGGGIDAAILNFALNLEYLEAEYYTLALTGKSLEQLGFRTDGMGVVGPLIVKANPKVPFTDPDALQYAREIALDEQRHVVFIRSTLGAMGMAPVARPTIDLLNSFHTLAAAAGLPANFDPFANDVNFLLGSYIFEDVGVSAYHGAAPLIQNKDVLSAAAGILGTEAYHAGLIRTLLYQANQGPATEAISQVRHALGDSVDYGVAQGPLDRGPVGDSSIVLADSNALVAKRTTREVLNIVYGKVNAHSGLFFPDGLNGPIN